jgi:pimeloyl-ACP methyl ester carboxylesterase
MAYRSQPLLVVCGHVMFVNQTNGLSNMNLGCILNLHRSCPCHLSSQHMPKHYLSFLLCFLSGFLPAHKGSAELHRKIIRGSLSGEPVTFYYQLPQAYRDGGPGHGVVYSLHGRGRSSGKNHLEFNASLLAAQKHGLLKDVIAVYPMFGANDWYVDSKDKSIRVETQFVGELIPWIDQHLNTIKQAEGRVIQGFSMGGYGASLFAIKYPHLFSLCMNFDGGMWNWEDMIRSSNKWEAVAPRLFDGDQQYYQEHCSPWTLAKKNRVIIRENLTFVSYAGSLGWRLEPWKEHLKGLHIPMQYTDTGCRHQLDCLLEYRNFESFRIIARHLAVRRENLSTP